MHKAHGRGLDIGLFVGQINRKDPLALVFAQGPQHGLKGRVFAVLQARRLESIGDEHLKQEKGIAHTLLDEAHHEFLGKNHSAQVDHKPPLRSQVPVAGWRIGLPIGGEVAVEQVDHIGDIGTALDSVGEDDLSRLFAAEGRRRIKAQIIDNVEHGVGILLNAPRAHFAVWRNRQGPRGKFPVLPMVAAIDYDLIAADPVASRLGAYGSPGQ